MVDSSRKSGAPTERTAEVDILKGFSIGSLSNTPVQIADYQKIQYEELLKEMQKDTQALSKAIVQTYLEMLGEQDTYEGRKERERLEKLSPIVILELVKKRFYALQEQTNKEIEKLDQENADTDEKAVDMQMSELTLKNTELQGKLKQLKERVDGLMKNIDEESRLRIEAAVHSRAVVEAIKEDKRKLERIIREKEEEIGRVKNVRGEKERMKKEADILEQQKEQIKYETKQMEKKYTEEIERLEQEYSKGFEDLGKRLESKRASERQSELCKKEREIKTIQRQIQSESENDKQMAKRLSEVQEKLGKNKLRQKELEEKDKIESRENARLKKDLEIQKKRNSDLTKNLKIWETKLAKDVPEEAKKIYHSIKKDIEGVLLSKTKQDDYIEEVLSSHTRLSPSMKDMITKERELAQRLKEKQEELKRLKKEYMMQRTQLWQEEPVRKEDITLLHQLLVQSTKSEGSSNPIPNIKKEKFTRKDGDNGSGRPAIQYQLNLSYHFNINRIVEKYEIYQWSSAVQLFALAVSVLALFLFPHQNTDALLQQLAFLWTLPSLRYKTWHVGVFSHCALYFY
eukprot:TRINITY_DN120261_c0_g1_i1.p1 TRINITY_DN120261_c0_g1~~TRINITY_DN120261_c0_g1_i1.p1  ORF type:complete len:607 (+),score=111.24 TRINITY_DN120261_c0_g1_i1:108-1823(+)